MGIAIATLLSPQARITHHRKRLMMSKSIVEWEGRNYVLHRFRCRATFKRFVKLIEQVSDSGASIQRIAALTATDDQQRRHGYCVALDYVPGTLLGGRTTVETLVSFGQNLARLHSVEGPDNEALFAAARPRLPHRAHVRANADLSADERTWIEAIHARLQATRANNLTHGDLYAGNIIAGADGRVSLIDYELMAFERAGIELAIALLRSFCRHADDRRLLLETYLAHCSPALAQAWHGTFADFHFAAAARLASQRRSRFWRLTVYNQLLKLRARLARSGRPDLERRIEKNEKLRWSAQRQALHYRRVARALVQIGLARPDLDAFGVFDAVSFDKRGGAPAEGRKKRRNERRLIPRISPA